MSFSQFFRTPHTCHVVAQSPKPQPSWPPTMWWRSVLIGFAIFVPGQGVPAPQGGTREGKLLWNVQSAQQAKFGGQTKCPALDVARPHDALPCTGGQMGWWFARLGAFPAQGGPFGFCKCGAAAGLVCESAKNGPLPAKTANRWLEVPDWSIVFQSKTNPKKTLHVWQATATVASAAEKRANLGQPGQTLSPSPVAIARFTNQACTIAAFGRLLCTMIMCVWAHSPTPMMSHAT